MSVFVWIETFEGRALSSSWEALGAARIIAEAQATEIVALVFGENAQSIAKATGQYGAASAIVCDDDVLREYRLENYAALLGDLVAKHCPSAVVAVASNRGRELLASAAVDSGSGLVSDVIELRLEEGRIIGVRPAYAGKVLMEMTANTATTFVTIRGRAFAPAEPAGGAAPALEEAKAVDVADAIATEIESFASELGTVSLTDAAIIVSGGRGMANNPKSAPDGISGDEANIWKAKDGYKNTLRPLADALGAALGASRAAVDAGYIAYDHQVGQTGKVVNPDLYIACGISGAIQHQAGMRGSKIIVAINKDAAAPIFKLARYGIVGDLYDVVPALTAALRQRLTN